MRLVVFSDSHGSFQALEQVVQTQPDAAAFLHLGDGEREILKLSRLNEQKNFYYVRGNCDWSSNHPEELLVPFAGRLVLLTHGHQYGVKQSLEPLWERARQVGAVLCCYGHTHIAACEYRDGITLLNPGSVDMPRDGKPSYAVVDFTEAGVAANIVRL